MKNLLRGGSKGLAFLMAILMVAGMFAGTGLTLEKANAETIEKAKKEGE